MTASLLNFIIAADVNALLDRAVSSYANDETFKPGMPRDSAAAIIQAVLWISGCRSDSFANAYAHDALFRAIEADGLLEWLIGHKEFEAKRKAADQSRAALTTQKGNSNA